MNVTLCVLVEPLGGTRGGGGDVTAGLCASFETVESVKTNLAGVADGAVAARHPAP